MSTKPIEEHYTAAQLAERLGLNVDTVLTMFKPGKIWPVVRLNARVIRVPASSVNRYLEAHTWDPAPIVPR